MTLVLRCACANRMKAEIDAEDGDSEQFDPDDSDMLWVVGGRNWCFLGTL